MRPDKQPMELQYTAGMLINHRYETRSSVLPRLDELERLSASIISLPVLDHACLLR